ncbi:GRIP1-associated protein 1 [Parasteatoda tepidariorum]|uniref:GRIP1-associated protein 1 n=1 Tax=Parasteatoda tepidariorum TaxID=114398 RepID=UPI001C719A3A|nr:GRIP1-associated protein 1 [Parasteatoda tepidariorum]
MATALSDEEFQRMQMQLLELRTKNYNLGEKNVKVQSELLQNNQKLEELRKELVKCQRIISRGKNYKEVEQFLQENEALQLKLQMQEDEFRLQNETLMQEVSSLVNSNEMLTKELELMKAGHLSTSEQYKQDDIIKLQAENAALKKLLSDYQNEGSAIGESEFDSTKKIELELKSNTALEENKLLQANMRKMENDFKEQLLKMQTENEKSSEKLKRKQESFSKLQDEKEKLYNENKNALESLQTTKDMEVQQLKDQIRNMQSEFKQALLFNEQLTSGEVNKDSDAVVELSGDTATFDCSISETKLSLLNIQSKIQTLNKQLSESEEARKDLEKSNEDLIAKLQDIEKAKKEIEDSFLEKSKLAENRKQLMDTMKNHLLETTNKHASEIENLTRQLADEQDKLQKLFDKEKETETKLIESRNDVQMLKEELERLRTDCKGSDSKVKDLEDELQKKTVEFEIIIDDKEKEHANAMDNLKEEMESVVKDLTIQLEVAKAERMEFEEKIKVLQQEAKDSVDERKIQEKKGVAMVKDLKRQLQVERNRAEKLQERLQEVLNDQNRPVDDILQSAGNFEKGKGDASSISSWSYVSGGTAERENKDVTLQSDTSSGGHDSPNRLSPSILETETNSLIAKVAELQQNNSTLGEKVSHLELSNEALVDDVLKKTALIQFYCMEGRSEHHASGSSQDKLTIKRIVDFIKDRGDENLKEINRRMQRLLEETLTKNMHLQNDIEVLSNEVSRLSKLASMPVENGLQSAVYVNEA